MSVFFLVFLGLYLRHMKIPIAVIYRSPVYLTELLREELTEHYGSGSVGSSLPLHFNFPLLIVFINFHSGSLYSSIIYSFLCPANGNIEATPSLHSVPVQPYIIPVYVGIRVGASLRFMSRYGVGISDLAHAFP